MSWLPRRRNGSKPTPRPKGKIDRKAVSAPQGDTNPEEIIEAIVKQAIDRAADLEDGKDFAVRLTRKERDCCENLQEIVDLVSVRIIGSDLGSARPLGKYIIFFTVLRH
jgi:hypothetical protein